MLRSKEEQAVVEEDTLEGKYLTFFLKNEVYGLEIRYITEIVGLQEITPIPEMPEYVKGVMNLRGKVIPIMDIRLRFRIEARPYDDRTCIIVLNVRDTVVGLVVDTVSEVIEIPADRIDGAHQFHKGYGNQFIKGMGKVGDKVKILLDAEFLVFRDVEFLEKAVGSA